jgi:hypothetical protein
LNCIVAPEDRLAGILSSKQMEAQGSKQMKAEGSKRLAFGR